MPQICVRFSDETAEKLAKYAKKRGLPLAKYLRHLVDLGFKLENGNNAKNADTELQQALQKLQIKSHKAALENLLITRKLYMENSKDGDKKREEFLNGLSENVQSYVDGLLGKDK